MIRKIKLLSISILSCFLFLVNAKADDCSYDVRAMLAQDASKINVHYEESGMYLNVVIEGLDRNFYLKTETRNLENLDVKFQEYIYGNQTGKQTILWTNTSSVNNVTFDVYASTSTACPNYKLTSFKVTLPMFNKYYQDSKCTDNSDKYVCKSFVTSIITQEEFNRAFEKNSVIDVDDEKEEKNNEYKESKAEKFIKENKAFIIAGFILITFGVVTGVILYKRKNKMF